MGSEKVEFVSTEEGDIVIVVEDKVYPIDSVAGEMYRPTHHEVEVRYITGKLKVGSYLTDDEIKELNEDIKSPNRFRIEIKNKVTNCENKGMHENTVEFFGTVDFVGCALDSITNCEL